MLFLFHGSDTAKVRAKAFAWVKLSRDKEPNLAYTRLDSTNFSEDTLAEGLATQGLFHSKTLVLLDDVFSKAENAELVLSNARELAESPNVFVVLAPKLLSARAKKLEAKASKTYLFDKIEKKESRGFNAPLVNALSSRNGELLWKELVKAQRAGDVPEMLHGSLCWQARKLMEKGNRSWSEQEARKLSVELIKLLSDSRSGDIPLGPALERFALSL